MSNDLGASPAQKNQSSALSHVEFLLRLGFFATAPLAIVYLAALFPLRGAIVDVALALLIFTFSEHARRFTARSRALRFLFEEALAFEDYYRTKQPRSFFYYLIYPALFPYWLSVRDARHEFIVFRGYNLGGMLVLLGTLGWQYFSKFPPELGWRAFLPQVWLTLVVEMFLALSLLMPIATSFVWYHGQRQRRRLYALLAVGCVSTTLALIQVAQRRDPIVNIATSERVSLRTKADRRRAHRTLLEAVRAARKSLLKDQSVEGDGKVLGEPLDAARRVLLEFYKSDEVLAFDLWASPRKRPRALVLYFEARRKQRPIWVAVDGYGESIRSPDQLPRGAFSAMRAASDGTEALLDEWPEMLDVDPLLNR
ncbi:MAG TPA: hypothetical protein VIV60_15355 [Polyangiaceae bacterium]